MSPLERELVQALLDERLRAAREHRTGQDRPPGPRVNRPWRKPRA
jgi:hypothetical protein